jgi:hypothetical protein
VLVGLQPKQKEMTVPVRTLTMMTAAAVAAVTAAAIVTVTATVAQMRSQVGMDGLTVLTFSCTLELQLAPQAKPGNITGTRLLGLLQLKFIADNPNTAAC